MKILKIEQLNENLKNLIYCDLCCNINMSCNSECRENIEDFKEFIEGAKEKKDIVSNNIDDILLFIETGFDLSFLDNDNFLIVYEKLKEIELNIVLMKLIAEYEAFAPCKNLEKKNICSIEEGNVIYIGEEVYLVKRCAKRTSKGYELLVELLLSGTFSYINSIYVDIKNEGFFLFGNIN